MIELCDIHKTYQQMGEAVQALKGITADRAEGVPCHPGGEREREGHLLNIISGLDFTDKGEVIVEGKSLSCMPDTELTLFRRRRVGISSSFSTCSPSSPWQAYALVLRCLWPSRSPTSALSPHLDAVAGTATIQIDGGALGGLERTIVCRRRCGMSRRLLLCILPILFLMAPSGVSPESFFSPILPGYRYAFPGDHFSHPAFQTEWWYYTGHLRTGEGKTYGYELTFFRTSIESQRKPESPSTWVMRDVYFAHLALSDEKKREFRFWEKINRKGPGLAGEEEGRLLVWNEGWRIEEVNGSHHLLAAEAGFGIDLLLTTLKPPVIHDDDGTSRKSLEPGYASHYYSLTRIKTEGNITLFGKRFAVTGESWMGYEFFSHRLAEDKECWDWFSIQLDNKREIMLYQLRLKGGRIDPVSSGTLVGPEGDARHITSSEFSITPSPPGKACGVARSIPQDGR